MDPGFPKGAQSPKGAPTYYFSRKPHENEDILAKESGRPLRSIDRQMDM